MLLQSRNWFGKTQITLIDIVYSLNVQNCASTAGIAGGNDVCHSMIFHWLLCVVSGNVIMLCTAPQQPLVVGLDNSVNKLTNTKYAIRDIVVEHDTCFWTVYTAI